jgi:autotransporter translocation and assembly factor TamB
MSARRRDARVPIGAIASTFNALGVLHVLAEPGVVLTILNRAELLRVTPSVSRSLARLLDVAAHVAELPQDQPLPNDEANLPIAIARQRFEAYSIAMGDAVATMLATVSVRSRSAAEHEHKAAIERMREVHAEWRAVHDAYERAKRSANKPGEVP